MKVSTRRIELDPYTIGDATVADVRLDGHRVWSAEIPYAEDGVIEGIESKIHRFCLGVQWHPEFHITASDTKLFAGLIAAARA